MVLQAVTGASIGKHALGLRVVDEQGRKAGLGRTIVRWLFLIIDGGIFLIGLITALVTHPHRRVGDLVAGTYVVARRAPGEQSVCRPDQCRLRRRRSTPRRGRSVRGVRLDLPLRARRSQGWGAEHAACRRPRHPFRTAASSGRPPPAAAAPPGRRSAPGRRPTPPRQPPRPPAPGRRCRRAAAVPPTSPNRSEDRGSVDRATRAGRARARAVVGHGDPG